MRHRFVTKRQVLLVCVGFLTGAVFVSLVRRSESYSAGQKEKKPPEQNAAPGAASPADQAIRSRVDQAMYLATRHLPEFRGIAPAYIEAWARENPDEAFQFWLRLTPSERHETLANLFGIWTSVDPKVAMQRLLDYCLQDARFQSASDLAAILEAVATRAAAFLSEGELHAALPSGGSQRLLSILPRISSDFSGLIEEVKGDPERRLLLPMIISKAASIAPANAVRTLASAELTESEREEMIQIAVARLSGGQPVYDVVDMLKPLGNPRLSADLVFSRVALSTTGVDRSAAKSMLDKISDIEHRDNDLAVFALRAAAAGSIESAIAAFQAITWEPHGRSAAVMQALSKQIARSHPAQAVGFVKSEARLTEDARSAILQQLPKEGDRN